MIACIKVTKAPVLAVLRKGPSSTATVLIGERIQNRCSVKESIQTDMYALSFFPSLIFLFLPLFKFSFSFPLYFPAASGLLEWPFVQI